MRRSRGAPDGAAGVGSGKKLSAGCSTGRSGPPPPINALAELVVDLIAATGLVPADKLAMVRSAAGMGSFAHALVEQNVAEALELSSRAYVLEQGQFTVEGPADQLLHNPELRQAYLGAV